MSCTDFVAELNAWAASNTGGSSSSGGTGGGGGSTNWWNPGDNPCVPDAIARTSDAPCPPGWVPVKQSFPPIIQADASIANNPIIKCVYDNLMHPDLQLGLKSILKSFDGSSVYHINFKPGPISGEGVTNYLGSNQWLTTINKDRAEDNGYSRIWLASTFIHEAFHAKLRQHAIELLGTDEIQNWPKSIDDMTLSELATYYEQSAQTKALWNPIGHDWMVNNIDELATSLREFVKKFYTATYANVGDNLDAYRALAYMGLLGSQFYQEKVVNTGIQNQFNAYRSALNEGGACSN